MEHLSPEKRKSLNKRHYQGALFRSAASICMWIFALTTYLLDLFTPFHFIGISVSVLFLILMNPPMLFILRHIKGKQHYEIFSLFMNQLEILGYTAVIYFSGGIEASYLALFYGTLIAYVGVVSSQKQSLIIASLCAANFSVMFCLIYFKFLPDTQIYSGRVITGPAIFIILMVTIALLFVIAFISATPATLLRAHRNRLRQQNEEMEKVNEQLRKEIAEKKMAEDENLLLQAQLHRAQKMEAIGTLAGGVAHDLNNILAGLVSYPELLLLEMDENNPIRGSLQTIQKSGEKVAAIVQDLLTLSRRERNIQEVLNLNDIITEYLHSPEYEKLVSFHPGIRMETHLETDLLNIQGSAVHLSKVIMNLVSNGVEAMPDGGRISITTRNRYIDIPVKGYDQIEVGDYITVEVADSGIGIPQEDIERIFEPFYTKKELGKSGTGLGMTVVWGTVKDHDGYIDVTSSESKGTTFILYFPVTRKEPPQKAHKLPIESYAGHGETILIVDDDRLQRIIASKMLGKLGYFVTTVSSGEEAVEYMKRNTADLVVLDMIMAPGMDGLETYKKIIDIHPDQKAIIASGFSENDRVYEAQKLGVGAYVKKPYILEKIGFAIGQELSRSTTANGAGEIC